MYAIIGILGTLGFLIFTVITIISAIKRNGKAKKYAIGILVSFVLFCVGVALPSSKDNAEGDNNIIAVQSVKTNPDQSKDTQNEVNDDVKETIDNENKEIGANINKDNLDVISETSNSEEKDEASNIETTNTDNNAKNTSDKTENIGDLKVHYVDVGQADSILIEQNGNFMLIDAGNNGDSDLVVNYLKKQEVSSLEYIIGTHPHEDHIGGLDKVIDTFDIGKVLMPEKTYTTKTFKDVINSIQNKGLKITKPVVGNTYSLGASEWTILAPNSNSYEDMNNYSIVIKLKFGNNSFIFTGDAEDVSEGEILRKQLDISADVLKIGHHGSHSSTTSKFLNAVNPKYAVISCGKDNDYGHPHQEAMDLLKSKNIITYRTDECGTIVATSNGNEVIFNTKPGDYVYSEAGSGTTSSSNNNSSTSSNTNNTQSLSNNTNTETNNDSNETTTVTSDNQVVTLGEKVVIIQSIDKKAEIVVIKNNSTSDVNMTGWRLLSVKGEQQFIFPQYTLKSGTTVTVYSGDVNGDFYWGRKNVWNNSKDDDGEIYDSSGKLIYSYDD